MLQCNMALKKKKFLQWVSLWKEKKCSLLSSVFLLASSHSLNLMAKEKSILDVMALKRHQAIAGSYDDYRQVSNIRRT